VPGKTDPVPALFGYFYLTEVIYAMAPGDTIPKFIETLEASDRIEAVFIGPAMVPEDEGAEVEDLSML